MNVVCLTIMREVFALPPAQIEPLYQYTLGYLKCYSNKPRPAIKLMRCNRILIVDDDEAFQRVLAFHIDLEEYKDQLVPQILCVSTGIAAVDVLTRNRIDLAFIDLNLPDMSGIDVLRTARKSGVRCYMISGSDAGRDEALSLGAEAYILKPYDPGAICNILRTLS